jgi:multiple sugar transport system permease protein
MASRRRNDIAAAISFLAPTLALIAVLRLVPAANAIIDSMHAGLPGGLKPPTSSAD